MSNFNSLHYVDTTSIKYTTYPGWNDKQAASMANIAGNVNEAMGLAIGTDKIYKNYDMVEDYANGGNSRFFTYNNPGKVSWMSIA